MSRVRNLLDFLNITDTKELARFLSNAIREIQQAINGNINFQDNFRGKILEVTFSSANADVRVEHRLGFNAQNYLVLKRSADLTVYDGINASSETVIWLRSSAVGTATIFVF